MTARCQLPQRRFCLPPPDCLRLKELLAYDACTGIFTWRVASSNRVSVGDPAGSLQQNGYIIISIDGVRYLAHRLAWLYCHGEWPVELDHRDGIRSNNSITNLRPATRGQNSANTSPRSSNKSGIKGVCQGQNGTWRAAIVVDGKQKHLGSFNNAHDASAAYQKAALEAFGSFAYGARK